MVTLERRKCKRSRKQTNQQSCRKRMWSPPLIGDFYNWFSLNWRGSSTSNRRHLLLIGCLSLDGKWNILVGQRFQGGLGNQMLARTEDPARKAPEQKRQRSLLGFSVGERDRHHIPCTFTSAMDYIT